MNNLRETVFFWLSFGILAPIILSKFYFIKGKRRIGQLRYASLTLQLVALVLLFFPWIETEEISFSGFSLAAIGNWKLVVYGATLVLSVALIVSRHLGANILGVKIAIVNSVWLFIIMLLLFPETKRLTWVDIAPIISVLMMLSNNVVALLLWHQLQLLVSKKSASKKRS